MVNSLVPSRGVVVGSTATEDSRTSDQRSTPVAEDDHWKSPKPEWTNHQYEFAHLLAVMRSNKDTAEIIDMEYLKLIGENNEELRNGWLATKEYHNIKFGGGGDVSIIQTLSGKYPANRHILRLLASTQEHYGNFEEAASIHLSACTAATEEAEKVVSLRSAALAHLRGDKVARALVLAERIRSEFGAGTDIRSDVLQALHAIYSAAKLPELSLGLAERLCVLRPDDEKLRFSLGYAHSDRGNDDVGLYHYLLIPEHRRSAVAWNNIGASFANFKIHGRSVSAYGRSIDMGETLAMSNLANIKINSGLLEEAQEIIQKAKSESGHHRNVDAAVVRLNEVPLEEEKKVSETLKKARLKSEFLREFGDAASRPCSSSLEGRWRHPSYELTLVVAGGEIRATGVFERSSVALALGGILQPNSQRVTVEYVGKVYGDAVQCSIFTEDGTTTKTLLGIGESMKDALLYFSPRTGELVMMEDPFKQEPVYYSLKKI